MVHRNSLNVDQPHHNKHNHLHLCFCASSHDATYHLVATRAHEPINHSHRERYLDFTAVSQSTKSRVCCSFMDGLDYGVGSSDLTFHPSTMVHDSVSDGKLSVFVAFHPCYTKSTNYQSRYATEPPKPLLMLQMRTVVTLSNNMGSCELEGMPPELQIEILSLSSSLDSLYNLIRASPRYYQVFLTMRETVLYQVICRLIGLKVLPDAIFLARCSQLPRARARLDLASTIEKIAEYQEHQQNFSHNTPVGFSTLIRLCQLQPTIEYHLESLGDDALKCLGNCTQALRTGVIRTNSKARGECTGKESDLLSTTEKARLRRALYRIELYGLLFYQTPTFSFQTQRISGQEQERIFLSKFPPWEVEEMASIWYYFHLRLGECFDHVEDKFVQLVLTNGASSTYDKSEENYEALTEQAKAQRGCHYDTNFSKKFMHSQMDDFFALDGFGRHKFFTCYGKRDGHGECMEYIFALGLRDLRQFLELEDDKDKKSKEKKWQDEMLQMRTVLTLFDKATPQRTFAKAYSVYTANIARRVTEWPEAQTYEPDDVSLSSPSAGYRWARKTFDRTSSFPCRHRGGLRSLGYVFWDQERLDASGVFTQQYDPAKFTPYSHSARTTNARPKNRFKKIVDHCHDAKAGQRKYQPSAELRLKKLIDERVWGRARKTMEKYLSGHR